MGISIDRYSHHYINQLSQPAPENKAIQRVRGERKFDEVLISASSRDTEEKKITEGLVQETMSQVRRQVPEERIGVLQEAVASGEYRVDAHAIAHKMLLTEVEGADE